MHWVKFTILALRDDGGTLLGIAAFLRDATTRFEEVQALRQNLTGIAVHIVVSQLPSLFGIAKGGGDLLAQTAAVAAHLSTLNPFSTAIGLGVLVIVCLAEQIGARIPGALIGVVLATVGVLAFDLEGRASPFSEACPEGCLA
jgi:MFS superfamily sulfate permease-like transporter